MDDGFAETALHNSVAARVGGGFARLESRKFPKIFPPLPVLTRVAGLGLVAAHILRMADGPSLQACAHFRPSFQFPRTYEAQTLPSFEGKASRTKLCW